MLNLLLRLLGMGPTLNAEIGTWNIRFANASTPFQKLLFVMAGGAAAYGIWWFYKREPEYCTQRRRKIMAALRLMGVLILLFIISNPVLDLMLRSYVKGKVVVLVDTSKSMSRNDTYSRPEDRVVPAHVLGEMPMSSADVKGLSTAAEAAVAKSTRWDLTHALFKNKDIALLEKLQSQYDVEMWNFARADEMQPMGTEGKKLDATAIDAAKPDGMVTEIGGALRRTIDRVKGQPLSGIVLITDGGNNKGEEPTVVAQDSPARIFPIGIGVPESQDVALTYMMMESKIFVDDPVRIEVIVHQHGFNGEQANLIVSNDTEELARQPITLRESGEQTEIVRVKAKKPGRFTYKVEIKLANSELHDSEPSNNFKTREVEVIDQKFNVLVIESEPRWEFRYLKNSLLRDKRVNCKVLLRVPDMAELAKQNPNLFLKEFPTREELFKFHVIVFGNMPNDGFFTEKDLDNVRKFVVEEGGGIWFIAGKNNFPDQYKESKLESLLPIEFERNAEVTADDEERAPLVDSFRAILTPDGRSNPILRLESTMTEGSGASTEEQTRNLWELMPPMYWCHKATRAKLGAIRLLTFAGEHTPVTAKRGEEMPLMVLARNGRGKVLYQAFADLWRMRYPIELGPDALERFHGHVVQYLGLDKLLGRTSRIEISTDKEEYAIGDSVKISARVLTKKDLNEATADHVTALVTDLSNESNQYKVDLTPVPGQKGNFRAPTPPCKTDGKFRVTLKDEDDEQQAHADFIVTIPQVEMDSPDMKKEVLDNIARSSVRGDSGAKAHMYFADQTGDLLKDIQQAQRPLEERKEKTLWDSPLLLILFTLMMGGEWLLRKRSDLL